MRKNLLASALLCLVGLGCSANVVYDAPRDQLGDMCSGGFVNTPSKCVDSLFVNSGILSGGYYNCQYWQPDYWVYGESDYFVPGYWYGSFQSPTYVNASCSYVNPIYLAAENTPALIIVTEAGNIDANTANLGPMLQTFPSSLRPYFRTLQNNTLAAFLSKNLEVYGKVYGRIYLVRSDSQVKTPFLETLKRVTNAHTKVDLLLAIHGSTGSWALSPDLWSYQLTSNELVNFAVGNMTLAQRNKVRAVFSTACYADSAYYGGTSMTTAVATAFPSSVNYGSVGVNWSAMNRDFIAFERYYAGWNFNDAVNFGNYVDRYNIASGAYRTQWTMPTLLVRACWDSGLWTDCANNSYAMGALGANSYMIENSVARNVAGVSGNIYTTIANFCTHPDTGARVLEGTQYAYYTQSTGEYRGECATKRRTSICQATGAWSPSIGSPRFSSCRDYTGVPR